MSAFRRFVFGLAVVLVALRLFFPAQRGNATDVFATLFHVTGILALVAALFLLGPTLKDQKLRRSLTGAALIVLWAAYVLTTVVGFRRVGFATSLDRVAWFPTALTVTGFLSLLSLTGFWFRSRWSVVTIGGAIAILFAGGVLGAWQNQWKYLEGGTARVNRWTGVKQTYECSLTADGAARVRELQQRLMAIVERLYSQAALVTLTPEQVKLAERLVQDMRARGKKYEDLSPKGKILIDTYRAQLWGKRAAEAVRRLRQKFPQYSDLSDYELAQLILQKYPEYEDLLGHVARGRPNAGLELGSVIGQKDHARLEEIARENVQAIRRDNQHLSPRFVIEHAVWANLDVLATLFALEKARTEPGARKCTWK